MARTRHQQVQLLTFGSQSALGHGDLIRVPAAHFLLEEIGEAVRFDRTAGLLHQTVVIGEIVER